MARVSLVSGADVYIGSQSRHWRTGDQAARELSWYPRLFGAKMADILALIRALRPTLKITIVDTDGQRRIR